MAAVTAGAAAPAPAPGAPQYALSACGAAQPPSGGLPVGGSGGGAPRWRWAKEKGEGRGGAGADTHRWVAAGAGAGAKVAAESAMPTREDTGLRARPEGWARGRRWVQGASAGRADSAWYWLKAPARQSRSPQGLAAVPQPASEPARTSSVPSAATAAHPR